MVLAGGCVVGAAPAHALEPGVHVDPGSPAAKEYAIPLSVARGQGTEAASSGKEPALFGAGITPPAGRGPGGGGSGHSSLPGGLARTDSRGAPTQASGSRKGGVSGASGAPAAAKTPPGALTAGDGHTGDGSLLALVGGGVLILVLAGFGGTVLRHSRPPRSTP